MIVGTAGHIDHGKTTLVRALTGVDTDRLPEEKTRGISIELGYAYLDVPAVSGADDGRPRRVDPQECNDRDATSERIGFIDVPGHERLVHTMLAGATGIDYALLLIAADDGVMPQTREHLAVLSLLGLTRGVVAITKIDRVDDARLSQVRAEAEALLGDTGLQGATMVDVSAQTGQGVAELRELLFDAARSLAIESAGEATRRPGAAFRLAIDRAFTLGGVGTVVTGTINAGTVTVGDEVTLTPADGPRTARVRSLHAQNRSVTTAHAGQRCAVGLVGVGKEEVRRGQWLVSGGDGRGTTRLDARLSLWHGEAKPLRSGTPVHVHIGATDVLGTVAVLKVLLEGGEGDLRSGAPARDGGASSAGDPARGASADALAPARTAYVQLVLKEPIGAWRDDRVVLRDSSSSRTLAGGVVLDPNAPVRYRRTDQRLSELGAWSRETPQERLGALVEAAPFGVSLKRWSLAEGLLASHRPSLADDMLRAPDNTEGQFVLGARHAASASEAVVTALTAFHAREPDGLGPDSARLRRLAAPRLPDPLWRALLAALQTDGRLLVRGAFVHLAAHGVRLSAVDERLSQKLSPLLHDAAFEGAWARDLARDIRESEPLVRTTLARLSQSGAIHQVVKDLYFSQSAIERLARLARDIGASHADGDVTAARFRDAAGLGRKRAIQLLEYFDRLGLLRRVGDAHRLRSDTALFT